MREKEENQRQLIKRDLQITLGLTVPILVSDLLLLVFEACTFIAGGFLRFMTYDSTVDCCCLCWILRSSGKLIGGVWICAWWWSDYCYYTSGCGMLLGGKIIIGLSRIWEHIDM